MVEMVESVRQALARPMPRAEVATVRRAAAEAVELSAELRRLQAVLVGGLGRQVGWAGTAELAFQESVAGELNRFAPAVQRLQVHATALADYARELERLGPPLQAARARLAAGAAAGSTAELADFERHWQDWDAARRRCMSGLAVGIPSHRHGWSALMSTVTRTVRHGPGLADLSRALGDLGQALVVTGVVLSLVCPPTAGAVWAAVAVVAVCQLAVDVTRRERGEHVGLAGLGLDMVAAVPGGRLIRSASEASAAIERLAPDLRSVELIPGGGLKMHEGTAIHRGHTLLKHVGKNSKQLARRFKTEPNLRWSSSFTDRQTAESAIARLLNDRSSDIAQWLASSSRRLELDGDYGRKVGVSVSRNGVVRRPSTFRVVLLREQSPLGYFIRTAYPE